MSESFERVMTEMADKVASPYWKRMADRLQIAHEYDMEMADKSAYHRGFEDGQRSMDAEHRAVAMRLQRLRLDEGSHENLSAIARAVHPNGWGWTQGACESLRDELIRLLGGIHDEPVPVVADCDACGDDCHRRDGETWRVSEPDSQKSPILENSDGEDVGEATITDELRECVHTATKQYDDTLWYEMGEDSEADHTICYIIEGELLRIADRIDEQFKRLCEQHEAVLQKTIDEMADECDRLIGECNERDRTIAKFKRAIEKYKTMYEERRDAYNRCAEDYNNMLHDHVNLKHKLDAIREALDG